MSSFASIPINRSPVDTNSHDIYGASLFTSCTVRDQCWIVIFESDGRRSQANIRGFCSKPFKLESHVIVQFFNSSLFNHVNKTEGGFFKIDEETAADMPQINDANAILQVDVDFQLLFNTRRHPSFDKLCDLLIHDLKMECDETRLQGGYVLKLITKNAGGSPTFTPVSFHLLK